MCIAWLIQASYQLGMDPLRFAQLLMLPWFVSEATVFLRDRQPGGGTRHDGGSRPLILIAMTAAVWTAFGVRSQRLGLLPGPAALWMAAGALLMLAGIVVRQRAVHFLGAYFRTHVTLLDDHRLVTTGPYARIRHPSYTGGLMSAASVGLAMGSLASLAVTVILPALAFAYRIRVEERALERHFGDEWRDYRASTAALIPGLW